MTACANSSRRGVTTIDCRRAQFSAEEPTARLRMICQSWKVMFHANTPRASRCACWSISERPSTTPSKNGAHQNPARRERCRRFRNIGVAGNKNDFL